MNRFVIGLQHPLLLLLVIVLGIMISWPLWHAGYYSDDMINSLIPGRMGLMQQSFPNYVIGEMQAALKQGRLYPLSVLSSVSTFYLFNHLAAYQIIHIIFIWLSVCSFALLIRKITQNSHAALLSIMLIPLCWSVRDTADPLTSFAILLPLVMLFITLTQLCYLQYETTHKPGWIALSLCFFVCALCTYEVGIVAFTLLFTLQYSRSQQSLRIQFKNMWPFTILLAVYLVTTFILHYTSRNVYEGIQIAFSTRFYHAFLAQAGSALPFSYQLFTNAPFPDWSAYNSLQQIIFLLLASLTFYLLLTRLRFNIKNCITLILIALNLIIVPALLIAISVKYQKIITPGAGYIPVFVQYFGAASLLLGLLGWLTSLPQTWVGRTLSILSYAILLSIALIIVITANYQTINQLNQKLSFNRSLVELALQHQLFATLPDNATLIEKKYLWNSPEFYWQNAHRKMTELYDIYEPGLLNSNFLNQKTNHYFITSAGGADKGYVLLAHVLSMQAKLMKNSMMIQAINIDHTTVFITAQNQQDLVAILSALKTTLNLSVTAIQAISTAYQTAPQGWAIITLPAQIYVVNLLPKLN